jgi:hypothetical protein
MITRLEALLGEQSSAGHEYSIEHLYEALRPDSLALLAQVLTWLTREHYFDRIYRVVAESGAGLRDFKSLGEVPKRILDDVDTGEEIPVTDKNIEVVYRVR